MLRFRRLPVLLSWDRRKLRRLLRRLLLPPFSVFLQPSIDEPRPKRFSSCLWCDLRFNVRAIIPPVLKMNLSMLNPTTSGNLANCYCAKKGSRFYLSPSHMTY
jgi:hypothetical protein